MSAKSPEVVDGMIDDSLLGILIILLVVMLSTGYVYVQQLRQGDAPARAPAARMAPSTAAALASAPERAAVSTAGLSDRQLRLHFTLPLRNGARTVTVAAEALLSTQADAPAWTHDDVPALLADLSRVADVYLLCTLRDAKDAAKMQRVREFVATHPDLKSNESTPGGVRAHKILFCTTAIGKVAFVRQIEPQVHVEVDAGVVRDLEKHVPRIVHIASSPEDAVVPSIPNVIQVGDSFASYFSLLSAKERL
ncbi:Peroxisome biogenesis protein 22 [Phytophthora cinnamomi]|uniref:Peroxisome biogenesis protein 22 n=1 Tax=Phytophthora cinnamomi TaxID=4785 RepID=UPI00355A9A9B|nr:Peroxisome biogenesis protein 22 [Phytophthora cinnamomi]